MSKKLLTLLAVLSLCGIVQAAPITLFDEVDLVSSGGFGNASPGTMSMDAPYSGDKYVKISFGTWGTWAPQLRDGQASLAELGSMPVSLWYRSNDGVNTRLQFTGILVSGHTMVTNNVVLIAPCTGGEWAPLQFDFTLNAAALAMDQDLDRDLIVKIQNFNAIENGQVQSYSAARVIDLDLIQLVPEPASLSVLALGGLALIRRRR